MSFPRFLVTNLLFATLAVLAVNPHRYTSISPTAAPYTYISLERLTIREGEGFLLQVRHGINESGCKLKHNDKEYDISHGQSMFTSGGELVVPMSIDGACAARIFNVKKSSQGQWELRNNRSRFRSVTVIVLSSVSHQCPNTPSDDCELINLVTNEKRDCGADVSDWEKYRCQYKLEGQLAYKEEIFPKSNKQRLEITQFNEVQEPRGFSNFLLECKSKDNNPIKSCVAEHGKTGRVYNIQDGLQHNTYSAFRTYLRGGICQFEIPKSTADSDVGRWTLRVTDWDDSVKEQLCHFLILPSSTAAKDKRQLSTATRPVKNLLLGSTINCAEFSLHPIDRCYIRSPSFEIKSNNKDCEFTVDEIGHWICGHNAETKDHPDILQEIQVYDNAAIHGKVDEIKSTLQCQHIYKEPLKTCLFVSPTKKPFSVPSEKFESREFYFYGDDSRHLTTGDCGIRFHDPNLLEDGTWECNIETEKGELLSVDIIVNGYGDPGSSKEVGKEEGSQEEDVDEEYDPNIRNWN